MKTYNFNQQLNIGKSGEEFVDKFFSNRYDIEEVSLEIELKNGIDRIYTRKTDGKVFNVEIKTDIMAVKTGNMFAELLVTHFNGKIVDGWIEKSKADMLLYYLPNKAIYCFPLEKLKKFVVDNQHRYRVKNCQNKTLYSTGLLIPLKDIEGLSTYYAI